MEDRLLSSSIVAGEGGNDQQSGRMIRGRNQLGYCMDTSRDDFDENSSASLDCSTDCAYTTSGYAAKPRQCLETTMMAAAAAVSTMEADESTGNVMAYTSQRGRRSKRTIFTVSSSRSMLLFAMISFLFLASLSPPPASQQSVGSSTIAGNIFGSLRLAAYAANDDDGANDDAADEDEEDEEDEDNNAAGAADDDYMDLSDISFDEVSVMPVSCLRYNNGHMIKFEFFENSSNYQCHFKNLGTFVVSIAHYMRAYFNHQALVKGRDFKLPGDAGYLNCVLLQETANADVQLYAKIGCMERETFTSTKLQLHVYTDAACSVQYDDGRTKRQHVKNGYDINGYSFGTKVSFRPPFYSCQTCQPEYMSDTFRKSSSYWYDDDYISQYGKRRQYDDDDANGGGGDDDNGDDDANADDDTYFQYGDDAYDPNYVGDDDYYHQNDDANNDDANGDDDGGGWFWSNWSYKGQSQGQKAQNDDDFYNRRGLREEEDMEQMQFTAAPGQLEAYEQEFWSSIKGNNGRQLEDNGDDYGDDDDGNSIGDWNMCDRVHKYGMWCDQECRALDTFRVDEWSASDIFLLVIMCLFMAAMMLLIFAKRVKAYEKASIFGDDIDQPYPGLPPMAMILVFILIMTVILVMANLKFVNETLVFAVVMCILLFIYMLKLTLFERKSGPALLPPPGQSYFS